MSDKILIKSFTAAATINPFRIVMADSDAGSAIQAEGPNASFLGISFNIASRDEGEIVDVVRQGIHELEYGDAVSKGNPLTSDSVGRAVPATFNDENDTYIIGFAEFDGVVGDIRPVEINKAIVPAASIAADTNVLSADVTITSAQLKALNATPKQLVAAPGANKAIIHIGTISYLAAGTAYVVASGKDIAIRDTNGSGAIQATIETTGFLDQTSAQVRFAVQPVSNQTPTPNAALVAHMLSGEITTGTADLKLRVLYRIIGTVL